MNKKTHLTKKDVMWGYAAKGFTIGSGLITLPIVLRLLSEGEIALNYLFLNLMTIVVFFDMGFSQQFARNFAFIFGGAQTLSKEGVPSNKEEMVNYKLLYSVVKAARSFYGCMSAVLAIVLLTLGSLYIYNFTLGFTMVENSLYIWLFFSLSIVFDFYFKYYTPLLMGKGLISDVNKIEVISTVFRLLLLTTLLFAGWGLWGVIISNFSRLVIVRLYSVHCFYSNEIKTEFEKYKNSYYGQFDILEILWYNAKKSMIVSIATYTCSQLGFLFSGIYLGKTDVAGYGLLLHLINIISSLSLAVNQNTVPLYSTLRARGDLEKLKDNLYFSLGVCFWIFLGGAIGLFFVVPPVLLFIGSHAVLPAIYISVITFMYRLLQNQHVICSTYMTSQNKIVDYESATILGIANLILIWVVLQFTDWGLMGIVYVQFLTALAYPNWKWPYEVCKEFKINYIQLVYYAIASTYKRVVKFLIKR